MKKLADMIDRNRFLVMVMGAIFIAIIWVIISVTIYVKNGTYLLDLSRPGYEPVREQVRRDETSQSFRSDGAITVDVLEGFMQTYNKEVEEINKLDDFSSSSLDDTQLQLAP